MFSSVSFPFKGLMRQILVLIFSLMALTACDPNDSGGVIVVDDTPSVPTLPGPYTQNPNTDNEVINPPSVILLPYTSSEIQAKVDAATPGSTIFLDRNVNLKLPVLVDKALTFTKDPSKTSIEISFKESGQFNIYSSGVKFRDLSMNIESSSQPIAGQTDSFGIPLTSDFTLEKNILYLRNTNYSLQFSFNDLKLKNNSFIGLCEFCRGLFVLNLLNVTGAEIVGNLIVDTNNQYISSLVMVDISNAVIKNNVVKAHARAYEGKAFGAVSMLGANNLIIQGNLIHDSNAGRLNAPNGEPNAGMDGSISLAIASSHGVTDGGIPNEFNSERYILSDDIPPLNISTGISFASGISRGAFDNDDLFNFFSTLDLHPICLGSNPGLKSSVVEGWLSYSTTNGSLYYAGAILPACL